MHRFCVHECALSRKKKAWAITVVASQRLNTHAHPLQLTVDIADLRYNEVSSPPSDNLGVADPRGERAHLVDLKISDERPNTSLCHNTTQMPTVPSDLYMVVGSLQGPQAQPPADALAYSGLNVPVHPTRKTVIPNAIVDRRVVSHPSWSFDHVRCIDHERSTNIEEVRHFTMRG